MIRTKLKTLDEYQKAINKFRTQLSKLARDEYNPETITNLLHSILLEFDLCFQTENIYEYEGFESKKEKKYESKTTPN